MSGGFGRVAYGEIFKTSGRLLIAVQLVADGRGLRIQKGGLEFMCSTLPADWSRYDCSTI